MKVIKYKLGLNIGTDDNPIMRESSYTKTLRWSETNEEVAKQEAFNGVYSIEETETTLG